ncbi:Mannosyl-oligosaccharide glucosidase GCS1 [Acorus gramineus]|uniref:Mannosyl-oligosaccharide glucosidase n=1 Tax=Acorus gramineus TaxID=55184 RepID=A0AAV9A497_ACOGR|nr:Mannosyl-oligosaccharide glucosidase GCS1 [Acorus gramineus]
MTPGDRNRRHARSKTDPSSSESAPSNAPPRNRRPRPRRPGDRFAIRVFDANIKTLLGFGLLAFLVAASLIYYYEMPGEDVLSVVTPLAAPKMMDLPQASTNSEFQGEHRESLYWGTYRPQVYLGIRARTPRSLIAGLMWIGIKDGQYVMRHVCQHSDDLSKYGWTDHNGRDYGRQVLVDHGQVLTTSFLKSKSDGSGYGGDWAVRLEVQKEELDSANFKTANLFFYLANEEGASISIAEELVSRDNTVLASGSHQDVGAWELHLTSTDNLDIHYAGLKTPHMHNLTELLLGTLGVNARKTGQLQLPDASENSPNIVIFQISGNLPVKMDVAFVSATGLKNSRVIERVNSLTGLYSN